MNEHFQKLVHYLMISVISYYSHVSFCVICLFFGFVYISNLFILENIDADGQGFCQGGFSIDFTKVSSHLKLNEIQIYHTMVKNEWSYFSFFLTIICFVKTAYKNDPCILIFFALYLFSP